MLHLCRILSSEIEVLNLTSPQRAAYRCGGLATTARLAHIRALTSALLPKSRCIRQRLKAVLRRFSSSP
jgi:hypothetical protein